MKKLLLLSGLLAGLTLLLVVLLLSDLGRRQAEGKPARAGPDVARAVVDTADPAGHAHRPAAGERGRRLEQVVQAAREVEEPVSEDVEPSPEQAVAADRARFRALEQQLAAGPSQPGRERAFSRQLTAGFHQAGLGEVARLRAVQCRGAICAVDLAYVSAPSLRQGMRQVINKWLAPGQPCGFHVPGPGLLEPDAAGRVSQRIFIDCRRSGSAETSS